jgi:hypothetical protein
VCEILAQPSAEAIERFLTGWYAGLEPSRPRRLSRVDRPRCRRRSMGFYDLSRRWPDAIVQNVVIAPPEVPDLRNEAWAETYIDDGKLAFSVENQGVCRWATSPEQVDPPGPRAALQRAVRWPRPTRAAP